MLKHFVSLRSFLKTTIRIPNSNRTATKKIITAPSSHISMTVLQSKLQAALWGFFSGDALSAPTHWYYGGVRQVQADYGSLDDYVSPKQELPGSILNKSNTNGGGRGRFSKTNGISIIGDVINHGKWDLWNPRKSTHYHATLQAGENTLEASLARVLMKSIVSNNGKFHQDHFRKAYMDFMTTPGSHNDTYASTCHRMFFANWKFYGKDPIDCPDNDGHNVDTIDGLILPTITALAYSTNPNREEAYEAIQQTIAVTRNSRSLEQMSKPLADLIWDVLKNDGQENETLRTSFNKAAKSMGLPKPRISRQDGISACYLHSSLPPLFDMMLKYATSIPNDVWTGVLANANAGGENVHRGSILGAILGGAATMENIPTTKMIDGLYHKDELTKEIDAFVACIMKKGRVHEL